MAELTVCEQCGKEKAAVFVMKKTGGSERKQALCLRCAEKQNVTSVKDYVKHQKQILKTCPLCEACGELPAMIFVSARTDCEKPDKKAFCAFCARERKLPGVAEMLEQMGMSDEELRQFHEDFRNGARMPEPESFRQKLRRIFKKS
jgi:protein-arginine kinase activator protein McsA